MHAYKVGDQVPSLAVAFKDDEGAAIDLSGCTVNLVFLKPVSGDIIDTGCTITSEPEGEVQYDWTVDDLDERGIYLAYFRITHPGGVQSVPAPGLFHWTVEAVLS